MLATSAAFTLSQHLDSVKSEFADVFAEPSGLPPDRGIEHVIPLEPNAQPPFKRMYRLSPSELVEVKPQVTELLKNQLIVPSFFFFFFFLGGRDIHYINH